MYSQLASSPQAKAPTGILSVDVITRGGLPRGRTKLVGGGPGSGKTIFAMEFLVHGAMTCDKPGNLVALENLAQRVIANFVDFGWDLTPVQPQGAFILDARLRELRGAETEPEASDQGAP